MVSWHRSFGLNRHTTTALQSDSQRVLSFPKCPDLLCGQPSLLFNGYLGAQNVQTCSGANPASYTVGTWELKMSRLALRPTQPPIQWVPGSLQGRIGRGVKLTQLRLVSRLRINGAVPPLPPHHFMASSRTNLLLPCLSV